VLLISFSGTAGYAETINVTTLSDDVDGSLRTAIASADSYDDVISFDVTGTIILDRELTIDHGLTIQGPGTEDLAISGNGACRVFIISSAESVDISGISIVSGDASGDHGGGIYNTSDKLTVENVTFSGNSAYRGGGMYNTNYSSPTVTNCTFTGNHSNYGGGIYNDGGSPIVTSCIFTGNSTSGNGGGMFNFRSSPTVNNSTFSGNGAYSGGGMANNYSDPTVTNCTFSENSAESTGGGMDNRSSSSPTVTNCTFFKNSVTIYYGGGMYNNSSDLTMTNCTFTGNSAPSGGGMYHHNGTLEVTNCIFWGDTPEEIISTNKTGFTYCVISDDLSSYYGDNNINTDPLLASLADNGGPTQTCALGEGSSAIDSGLTMDTISSDQRGFARPWPEGGSFDIGAFEYIPKFSISTTYSEGGTIDPENPIVSSGEDVTFTITADESYHLSQIDIDGEPYFTHLSYEEYVYSDTYTFSNVTSDHTISATFAADESDDPVDPVDPVDPPDDPEEPSEEPDLEGGTCSIGAFSPLAGLLALPLLLMFKK